MKTPEQLNFALQRKEQEKQVLCDKLSNLQLWVDSGEIMANKSFFEKTILEKHEIESKIARIDGQIDFIKWVLQ